MAGVLFAKNTLTVRIRPIETIAAQICLSGLHRCGNDIVDPQLWN